ncbi:hypothetical protein [Desulfofundulus thermocisternus]|uniref:hypothetical protein n=1 Tax=Desulfofundulus thermocisternus TaxID=42471 RepID=UPI00217CEC07|nr:hypothetical protein [Desulfofundulus thermocisternus]MCS5695263.1 hypothetical protein [Desulfofundulus thermocisternus]
MQCIKKDCYDYYYDANGDLYYACESFWKHTNPFSLNDPLFHLVEDVFKCGSIRNYNMIRRFYWTYCNDYEELKRKIYEAIEHFYSNGYRENLDSVKDKQRQKLSGDILNECLQAVI